MTRDESLAKAEARLQAQLDKDKAKLARIQAQRATEARKDLNRRRAHVGKLADDAGLLAWEDGTLAGLFQALATLRDVPDPVAVLDGLLSDTAVTGGEKV